MFNIVPISALSDNYIWCIQNNSKQAILVDPADAKKAIEYLKDNQLSLVAILITHHHYDHIGGVSELVAKYKPLAL